MKHCFLPGDTQFCPHFSRNETTQEIGILLCRNARVRNYILYMLRKKITTLFFILTISTALSIGCGAKKEIDTAVSAEAMQDRIVTSAIKERLAELATSSKIDVETDHGNVTLSGTVASPAEGNRVIESILSLDGVRSLSPVLTVD